MNSELLLVFLSGGVCTALVGIIGNIILKIIDRVFALKDKKDETKSELESIWELIRDEVKKRDNVMTKLTDQLNDLKDSQKEQAAKSARLHILQFSDECRNGIEHSEGAFKNVLDSIDEYNEYCNAHDKFKNGYTVSAEAFIRATFDKKFMKEKEAET